MVAIAILQLAGPQPTAAAHDQLVGSSPVADSTVTAPAEIRLTFSEPITPGFAAVTLAVDNGPARPIDLRVDGAVLIAIPPTVVPASVQRWTLAYRIVSSDGHPIVDQLQFRVAPSDGTVSPATGQSTHRNTASPRPPATGDPAPGPDRRWRWWAMLAAALLVIAVATAARARRRTSRRGSGGP